MTVRPWAGGVAGVMMGRKSFDGRGEVIQVAGQSMARLSGGVRRIAVGAALLLGAAFAVPVLPSSLAGAVVVDNPMTASAQCIDDGTYVADYTITNTSGYLLHLDAFTFTAAGGFLESVTPNPVPVGGSSVIHTGHIPGQSNTPAGVTVQWHYDSPVSTSGSSSASVPLDGLCASFFHAVSPQRILD